MNRLLFCCCVFFPTKASVSFWGAFVTDLLLRCFWGLGPGLPVVLLVCVFPPQKQVCHFSSCFCGVFGGSGVDCLLFCWCAFFPHQSKCVILGRF